MGFSVGVFSAFTPFIGFHTVITLFVVWLVRANYFSSIIGTFVGTPITYPFMWVASMSVGSVFLEGEKLTANYFKDVSIYSWDFLNLIKPFLFPFLFGSIILGSISAILSYYLVKKLVIAYRKRKHINTKGN